jgi:glycosyltransferase involved in cell wall biosynthesis
LYLSILDFHNISPIGSNLPGQEGLPVRNYYRKFRAKVLQRLIPRSRRAFVLPGTIEIAGYFSMTAGVGESARLCADALAQAGMALKIADVSTHHDEARDVEWTAPAEAMTDASTRILHLNPPMLPRGIVKLGLTRFTRTFNIGYWAWELETIPDEWRHALRYMNAVFVPSEFTRQAIARHTSIPVITVPHPVSVRPAAPGIRAQFGIAEDAFLVSSIFSAGSSINRKNPHAVLAAFRQFAANHPKAFLLMKASGNPVRDEALRALIAAASDIGQVRILTENLPSSAIAGIIGQSDAYISLHRSEGFGLTVAEAILAGTPVVSTGWSGTVDFCDPENTWSTDYRLVPVVDTHPEFASLRDARWADASADHAAQQLAEIAGDPVHARSRAAAARNYLERYLAAHTYGAALAQLAGGHR